MFSTPLIVASAAIFAGVAVAQNGLVVNTATTGLTQCQPYRITWNANGVAGPYFVAVTVAGQTNQVLKSFPQTNDDFILWNPVDQPAGTSVTFTVLGADGVPKASAPSVPIGQGSSDCLNGSNSAGAGGAAGSSSAAGPSSSAPASSSAGPTSSAPSSSAGPSSSVTRPSSSVAPTQSTPVTGNGDGAVSIRGSSAVVAAVVGVFVAALL